MKESKRKNRKENAGFAEHNFLDKFCDHLIQYIHLQNEHIEELQVKLVDYEQELYDKDLRMEKNQKDPMFLEDLI
jgi:hypothetical protein